MIDGQKSVKARLVARGFEENSEVRSDSPTANKESFRIFLAITSTMVWKAKAMDIKAAFLQGEEINRTVSLQPPREAGTENKLWLLRTFVYGLNDASRKWYFSVWTHLLLHGCRQTSADPGFFIWLYNDCLQGIFIMHVDDFLWSGTDLFKEQIMILFVLTFSVAKKVMRPFST